MQLFQLIFIHSTVLYYICATPVGPTGPVLEAEGWTPVRSSQAVRIPEQYINEGPVNTNPAENIAYNNDPTYGLYEKTGVQEITSESQTSNRRTDCNIKNGECVPKCSELTEEERNKGLQCEVDNPSYPSGPKRPSEVTSAPWEAVPPQYDISDFGENDNSNRVINSSPQIPNEDVKRQPQQRRYDNIEEYDVSQSAPLEQNPDEELEIQRQQEYSGFGEKISTNHNQIASQPKKPQVQTLPPSQENQQTESNVSYQEKPTDIVNDISSVISEEIEEVKTEKSPMIVYPAGSDQNQPLPNKEDNEESVFVQTASVVRPEEDQLRQRLPQFNQQPQFSPRPPPRAPHLRPHPPNRPPLHHPQTQSRPLPRRPGPPKRISNTIPGGVVPQRPLINGRPSIRPPPQRRPQPEALPRSSDVGPNEQFVSTQSKGPSLAQRRQPRPQAPAESRQVATITAPGVPPPSEAPQAPPRRPLPRQPPPNRGRPRPIRPRPNRRPQKGFLDRVRDGVDKAACKAQTFVSGQMLNNEKFIRKQINCVLEKGECDETGAMVKRLAPDVLNGKCPKPCTPCKQQQIKMMMSAISRKYPKEFTDVIRQVKSRN